MATVGELKDVLKENLSKKGVLNGIKSQIQAAVFKELEDESEEKPVLSNENLLLNELILEYLQFNGYSATAAVLQTESGHPDTKLGREFVDRELKVFRQPGSENIPLLYMWLERQMKSR